MCAPGAHEADQQQRRARRPGAAATRSRSHALVLVGEHRVRGGDHVGLVRAVVVLLDRGRHVGDVVLLVLAGGARLGPLRGLPQREAPHHRLARELLGPVARAGRRRAPASSRGDLRERGPVGGRDLERRRGTSRSA